MRWYEKQSESAVRLACSGARGRALPILRAEEDADPKKMREKPLYRKYERATCVESIVRLQMYVVVVLERMTPLQERKKSRPQPDAEPLRLITHHELIQWS
jgi:hypothetical protein